MERYGDGLVEAKQLQFLQRDACCTSKTINSAVVA